MEKKEVCFKEDEEGRKFPFLDFGAEAHGRTSFRLWVSGRLVKHETVKNYDSSNPINRIIAEEIGMPEKEEHYYIEFPMKNAKIFRTQRGNLVLRPNEGTTVFYVFVPCGYRGESEFEILSDYYELFPFEIYESPRGRLGISRGALVNAPTAPLVYRWERTGRLYGKPAEGVTIITPGGEEKVFEDVEDLEELEELRGLIE